MNSSGEKRMEAARKPRYDQRLVRWCRECGYAAWLGASLAAVGYHPVTWQFWVVMLPTVFLIEWKIKTPNDPILPPAAKDQDHE